MYGHIITIHWRFHYKIWRLLLPFFLEIDLWNISIHLQPIRKASAQTVSFFKKSINLSMQFFEHHLGTILELESDNIPQPPNVISSQNFEMNGWTPSIFA